MDKFVGLLLLLFWLSVIAVAQNKSDTLKEIKVHSLRNYSSDLKLNEFAPGEKIKAIDSATLQKYELQNLATLLSQQVPVFVKSYGFNGLATLSFRGASAAQSTVLWNGVPIQNAALGIADISTLPVMFMNKVNIVYGGSSALWGSGNVGGALLLENEHPVFDTGRKSLSFSGGMGSFSQYLGGINGSVCNRRWYFFASFFAQSALNNFPYTTLSGQSTRMPNDHLKSSAGLVHIAYKINGQNTISLSAWTQQYNREIPPALFETYSIKKQVDGSLRLVADWTRQSDKNTWYTKSSFIRDDIKYSDNAISLNTNNAVYQYFQEIGWKKQFGYYGRLLLFSPEQISWINIASGISKYQNKAALAVAYDVRLYHGKLNLAINTRGEMINTQSTLLPGADACYTLTQWLLIRANMQKSYRAPSLNELYYYPGGNPSLKAEHGWNEDLGYTIKAKGGRITFYHDLSFFTRDIHDWIIWLGGAIWTPHNIAEVHSRGIETENNITYITGKWKFYLGINTAYALATAVASYLPNDGSIGKQIPYTPRYNGQLNAGFEYLRFAVNYNHTYTGYRFLTSDESEYIEPYQTGNLQIIYHTTFTHHDLDFTVQCNNIWNEQYQVVAFRPMPGINWLLGFKIRIL